MISKTISLFCPQVTAPSQVKLDRLVMSGTRLPRSSRKSELMARLGLSGDEGEAIYRMLLVSIRALLLTV